MIPRTKVLLALAFALFANDAVAHHNMTAVFDFNDRVTLSGTLTKVDWRNPHTYLTVEVKAADGSTETWQIEGPAPSFFRIRDFGKGISNQATMGKSGVGISGMRERVMQLHGDFIIARAEPGTLVEISLPILDEA